MTQERFRRTYECTEVFVVQRLLMEKSEEARDATQRVASRVMV